MNFLEDSEGVEIVEGGGEIVGCDNCMSTSFDEINMVKEEDKDEDEYGRRK